MAGMLPGVEAARRRRVHQSSGTSIGLGLGGSGSCPSSRRSSFSLFSTNSSSNSSMQQRLRTYQGVDEKLGQLARQAKERLDERLRAQNKSPLLTPWNNSDLGEDSRNQRAGVNVNNVRKLRTELYGTRSIRRISDKEVDGIMGKQVVSRLESRGTRRVCGAFG